MPDGTAVPSWLAACVGAAAGLAAATVYLSTRQTTTPRSPPGDSNDNSSAPPVIVVLHEATADRYIHYLLRPAAALGASEVIWVGGMRAKGEVKRTTEYGRHMDDARGVPLASVAMLKQARRRIADTYGVRSHQQRWFAVSLAPTTLPSSSEPEGGASGTYEAPVCSASLADAVARGTTAANRAWPIVLYFTGPRGADGAPVRGEWDGGVALGDLVADGGGDNDARSSSGGSNGALPEGVEVVHLASAAPATVGAAAPQQSMSLASAMAIALHALGVATGAASVGPASSERMLPEEKYVAAPREARRGPNPAERERRRAAKLAEHRAKEAVMEEVGFADFFD